ncbi:MAG: putative glycogen debranching enzyme [Planctomycetota bacterium]|jgi:predicted glycogen debranching enzyme
MLPLPIRFADDITRDIARASSREWLESNGLGGWASSTVSMAHTRRYHGLLVAAQHPPVGRVVLLSHLDESLILDHGRLELGCHLFPGAVSPQGHQHLSSFSLDPCPTFLYTSGEISLRKRIAMLQGEDTVLITYELTGAPGPLHLELRPFFAGRDYHHLMQANDGIERHAQYSGDCLSYAPYQGLPTTYIQVPSAHYKAAPDWYYNYQYPREEERGLDASEDLFTPGLLTVALTEGQTLGIIVSTQEPTGRSAASLLDGEIQRRTQITLPAAIEKDPLLKRLAVSVDQFLVQRGNGLHTILAGYPWFTDWGRDTMIALPGTCLVTGKFAEAKSIFRAFAEHVDQGLIPNRFPDHGDRPDYNTVDATLWFFSALYKYVEHSGDFTLADELWPVLQDIIVWHERGTHYHIGVDDDGLLSAGEHGTQLTWMDAKVGDWVVTPRQGKAVEINALWYNALCIAAFIAEKRGEDSSALNTKAEKVRVEFAAQFWNEELGCLYDVIGTEDKDAAIRPNQILALSLPFPLIEGERAARLFAVVDEHLFTPRGLRSLSPQDPSYRSRYLGGPWERDGAYHQGIVWGWLIGPFLTALARQHGAVGKERGREIVHGFSEHLYEAGLGSISEIFDAEPPFAPRGCFAQAWSVAELLRAAVEDLDTP